MKEMKWNCLERLVDMANLVKETNEGVELPWVSVGQIQQKIEAHYELIGEAEDFWAEDADLEYIEYIHEQIDLIWGVSIEEEEE